MKDKMQQMQLQIHQIHQEVPHKQSTQLANARWSSHSLQAQPPLQSLWSAFQHFFGASILYFEKTVSDTISPQQDTLNAQFHHHHPVPNATPGPIRWHSDNGPLKYWPNRAGSKRLPKDSVGGSLLKIPLVRVKKQLHPKVAHSPIVFGNCFNTFSLKRRVYWTLITVLALSIQNS